MVNIQEGPFILLLPQNSSIVPYHTNLYLQKVYVFRNLAEGPKTGLKALNQAEGPKVG